MKIQKSTANALIVLLMGIFIFQSLASTEWVKNITSNHSLLTIVAAILVISFRNKITTKIGFV